MIGKHGFKDFFLFASHNIDVSLGIAVRIEIDILIAQRSVFQYLAALNVDALTSVSFDFQPENSRIVLTEVVNIAALLGKPALRGLPSVQPFQHVFSGFIVRQAAFPYFHRLDFLYDGNGFCPAHFCSPPWPIRHNRLMPAFILLKSRLIDYIIRSDTAAFQNTPFIGTGVHYEKAERQV